MNAADETLVRSSYMKKSKDEITIMQGYRDFEDFIEQEKYTDENNENGAILVITDKQYILTLNGGMGQGGHMAAYAQVDAMLKNTVCKNTTQDIMKHQTNLRANYCYARIMAETNDRAFGFNLPRDRHSISPDEFASFMAFYDEYGYTIREANFKVYFGKNCMTIDDLQMALEQIVDYNMGSSSPDDEIIVGTPTEGGRARC